MRALTLHRPWPFAIFHAPPDRQKDIENRPWSAAWVVGEQVAIHAGQTVDAAGFDYIEGVCGVRPPDDAGPTGIVGMVRFDDMLEASLSPWFFGPFGWLIGWRQALSEPVPCPGMQKLWTVPTPVERQLRRQLAAGSPRRRGIGR